MKTYICPFCNKEFESRQKFIAHKRFCKLNPEYHKNMEQIKNASKLGVQKTLDKLQNQKTITKTFICEKCGKEFAKEYTESQLKFRKKFPRFCSIKCSNRRVHSEETKRKISNGVSIFNNTHKKIKEIVFKKCCVCNKDFVYNNQNPKKVTCSLECHHKLLSQKVQQRIKDGTHKGWQSRKIISYPEKFFMKVLQNNNIPYEHNYVVKKKDLGIDCSSCYFLDFKLPNNIDLEIDGGQHKDRIEHDLKRDKILTEHNYKVYRIEWNNINTTDGKKLMKNKIDEFMEFYRNILT